MSKITADTYSEVYSMLNALGESFIKRIPEEKYQEIIERKNNDYNPKYHIDDFEDDEMITTEARSMIALYHIKYWCDSEEERKSIQEILEKNEQKLNEKYDPFRNRKIKNVYENENIVQENLQLVEVKESGIWNRIKSFIRKIIGRI